MSNKMKRYAIVGQSNWREMMTRADGSTYVAVGFRAPPNMQAAKDWPGTRIIERPAEADPPRFWGHGTYAEVNGHMMMVASDFDTSG